MITYIALLRGINVSGHKKIIMADLRVLLDALGYNNVITYIQSGNVIFKSNETNVAILQNQIHEAILESYNFEVEVLVKKRNDLEKIVDQNPYTDTKDLEENKIYFVLLKEIPEIELVRKLKNIEFENEQFIVSNECIYLRCGLGAGKAKCNNNFLESTLKISATSRNYRTVQKLLELSKD